MLSTLSLYFHMHAQADVSQNIVFLSVFWGLFGGLGGGAGGVVFGVLVVFKYESALYTVSVNMLNFN